MSNIKLSVVIPARNEFPNVVHTVHSILAAWETSYKTLGWDKEAIEIIIVNNTSTDRQYPKTAVKGTVEYLMPRGMYANRYLRVMYYPVAGNHAARNHGARMARGDYLFFSDAHMSYAPLYFFHLLTAVKESGGIAHSPIGWHGTYPPRPESLGYQYTIKLGDEWRGTWAQRCLSEEKWFYIPALGHCSVAVKRDQFIDFGGYPEIHRTYGGGEMYVNMKWWMLGSTVVTEPRAVGYHLASERGYSYNFDNYIENVLGCMYALGIDDWRERTFIHWLRKGRREVLDQMMERSTREHQRDREKIQKRKTYSFNDLLLQRPWDKKNIEKFGESNCGLQIYHPSFIQLLKNTPAEDYYYHHSKYQRELDALIEGPLWEFVYKKDHYEKVDGKWVEKHPSSCNNK